MNWCGVLLFTVCAVAAVSGQELVVSPVSSAEFSGQTVVFQCTGQPDNESPHPYTWQYNPMSDNPIAIVYDCEVNPAYADLYSTEVNAEGGCDLTIRSITTRSAGLYTCQHWMEQGSAHLVVLNSNTNCNFSPADLISGDLIEIQCYVNYNGSIPPSLDFRSETGDTYSNATINTFPNQVNGRVQFPVYPPVARAATANTFFDPPIMFSATYFLPGLLIQFPVTNTSIALQSESECGTYANYTTLTCTAEGYPSPTIQWLNVNTNEIINAAKITISDTGLNEFVCTTANNIRGVNYSEEDRITVDIIDGEPPAECSQETTTEEPTTEVELTTSESTTTTTTTTTTSPMTTELVTECGTDLRVAENAAIEPGFNSMCYISRTTDPEYLNTQCRDLIQNLPPNIGDYESLLQRGGNFGCAVNTRNDFVGSNNACFDNYQQTVTLAALPTAVHLFVCIRLPPN